MGDLRTDTEVAPLGDDRYEATLSDEWEIWGPMGGYVAACALRAGGCVVGTRAPGDVLVPLPERREVRADRPPGRDPQDRPHRDVAARRGHAGRPRHPRRDVCGASATSRDSSTTRPSPDVPDPDDLPNIEDLLPDDARPPFPFWNNLDAKPLQFEEEWPPDGPAPACWQEWLRFRPTATFEDPWVDAARSVILVDLPSWPSAHRPHA